MLHARRSAFNGVRHRQDAIIIQSKLGRVRIREQPVSHDRDPVSAAGSGVGFSRVRRIGSFVLSAVRDKSGAIPIAFNIVIIQDDVRRVPRNFDILVNCIDIRRDITAGKLRAIFKRRESRQRQSKQYESCDSF
jgi:hypothetical protein